MLAVSQSSDSEEDTEQELNPGPGVGTRHDPEQPSAEKENNPDGPRGREVGAKVHQVSKHPRTVRSAHRTLAITCCWQPTDHRNHPPAAQVEQADLLKLAQAMFPEGLGSPNLTANDGATAPLTVALLVNTKGAIFELWKLRGYDPKKPALIKQRLGYMLDKEEAAGYVLAALLPVRLRAPVNEHTRAIGKRAVAAVLPGGTIGKELASASKRGASAKAAYLQGAATLNTSPPPPRTAVAAAPLKPPPPPPPPPPPMPKTLLPSSITNAAAAGEHFIPSASFKGACKGYTASRLDCMGLDTIVAKSTLPLQETLRQPCAQQHWHFQQHRHFHARG